MSVDSEVQRAQNVVHGLLDGIGEDLLRPATRVRDIDRTVNAKSDGTPVTAADLEVDERLRAGLAAKLPDHGVVSEESDTRVPATTWTWIIDPIDGTSNFVTGVPYWCVSLALAHEGTPVMGIVDAPVLGRRYVAVHGQGARRDGEPLRVRSAVDWRDPSNRHIAAMLTTATARRARAAGMRLNGRVMGSTALDLAMVAEGAAVASIAVIPHVWDIAAGAVLVAEAGGETVTVRGEPMLPLVPGVDHARTSAVTAAAETGAYARELTLALLPD